MCSRCIALTSPPRWPVSRISLSAGSSFGQRNLTSAEQLADATATLDKVTSSLRDLPRLQLPLGDSEKLLPAPRSSSGWVAAASSSGKQKQRTKAAKDVT